MAATKCWDNGQVLPQCDVTPARSPGPLGLNDAADPNACVCLAGDTPGPVGTGSDAGAALLWHTYEELLQIPISFPALSVDLNRMRRFVYTVTYAEETDRAATRGFASMQLQLGEESKIEAAASIAADKIMENFHESLGRGPLAVQELISALEERKNRASASLNNKFAEAGRVRSRWLSLIGSATRVLIGVKFAATVTIKTLSIGTGRYGDGIDILYSGVLAGNKQWQSPDSNQTYGVVIEETVKNYMQETVEEFNDLLVKGIITKEDLNKFTGLIGNYKGNAEKLKKEIHELEERILKVMDDEVRKKTYMSQKIVKKRAALERLRKKSLAGLMRKGVRGTLVASKTMSLVFLTSEVIDAYREAEQEWRASSW